VSLNRRAIHLDSVTALASLGLLMKVMGCAVVLDLAMHKHIQISLSFRKTERFDGSGKDSVPSPACGGE